ncbi:MAG: YdcH family protein [Roseibium sp.]|nr:YdcH family protein [Roseibium sp.]
MYTRLRALRSQHESLDVQIRREQKRPAPDDGHIRTLKKFKLRIRDEMARLERVLERKSRAEPLAS